jgi:hypothetical protein
MQQQQQQDAALLRYMPPLQQQQQPVPAAAAAAAAGDTTVSPGLEAAVAAVQAQLLQSLAELDALRAAVGISRQQ